MQVTHRNRIAIVAIVVAAAVLRIYHLTQPMRYDEAWSFLHYSSQPLAIALSDYTLPNNHMFHTLLSSGARLDCSATRPGSCAFRRCSPASRPGPGDVMPPLRAASALAAALVAAALAAALPSMVLYSTNARGYMIIATAFMALLLVGDEILVRADSAALDSSSSRSSSRSAPIPHRS